MPVNETDVGITSFTDQRPGFSAILKHTWRDFHVNEISLNGEVLHLKTLQPEAESVIESSHEPSKNEESLEETIHRLEQLVGKEDAEKLNLMKQDSPSVEFIQLGPFSDKKQRTAVHEFFKSEINGFPTLVTETIKENELTYIRVTPFLLAKKNSKWDKRNRIQPKNKSKFFFIIVYLNDYGSESNGESCRYLHFILYKENMDNQMAITTISKSLGVPPSAFRTAGTKDKRGMTTQMVSAQNMDSRRLATINSRLQRVKVGNFQPSEVNLYVGDLLGNEFQVALRNVHPKDPAKILEACEGLKSNGFLNYFGLQRFGQGYPTHLIGIALLKGDWKTAAQLILKPTSSDNSITTQAKELYSRNDLQGALNMLPKKCLSERALLEGYIALGSEKHLQSINRINRNTRTLYVHAYQSYVWNQVVSERVRLFGPNKILEGDIVLKEDNPGKQRKAKDRLKSIHCVTKEDIQLNKYSIEDIVMPIPGSYIEFPKNEMEGLYHEIAQHDGISLTTSKHKVKEFSIEKVTGDYRKMIVKVPDLEYELVQYSEPYEPLITSDLEKLQEAGVEGSYFPDTFVNDEQGKRKAEGCLEDGEDSAYKKARVENEGTDSEEKMALKLKFKLPASSYATMLIRQLTKYSTSKTAQIAITTGNDTNNAS